MISIIYLTIIFSCLDFSFSKIGFNGTYYFNHFIANSIIVYNTFPDLLNCYFNLDYDNYQQNNMILNIIFSLHLYHILYYFEKLRFDDWLHHIIMVLFTLPISLFFNPGPIIGHSIFFLTGLPGGIDYLLLFLVKNGIIDRMIEKKYNAIINKWIRCPGALFSSQLILQFIVKNYYFMTNFMLFISILIFSSVYWNGVYFMGKIVENYIIENNKKIEK